MRFKDTNGKPASTADDPHILALMALGWVVSDDSRRDRLLALTGLSGEDLTRRCWVPFWTSLKGMKQTWSHAPARSAMRPNNWLPPGEN